MYGPRKLKKQKPKPVDNCVVCGKEFTVYRKWQRFCGIACKNAYHYKERVAALKAYKKGG
jgi:hypothetical protein